jgi:hypothetical protein
MDDVNSALKQSLTINDNFMGKIMEVEVDGQYPIKIKWDLPVKPISVLVGNWYRKNGAAREVVLVTDGDIATGTRPITNMGSIAGLHAGLKCIGDGIPDNTQIAYMDNGNAYLDKEATATDTNVTFTFTYDQAIQVRWSFNQAGQLVIEDVIGLDPSPSNKFILVLECKTG